MCRLNETIFTARLMDLDSQPTGDPPVWRNTISRRKEVISFMNDGRTTEHESEPSLNRPTYLCWIFYREGEYFSFFEHKSVYLRIKSVYLTGESLSSDLQQLQGT